MVLVECCAVFACMILCLCLVWFAFDLVWEFCLGLVVTFAV